MWAFLKVWMTYFYGYTMQLQTMQVTGGDMHSHLANLSYTKHEDNTNEL